MLDTKTLYCLVGRKIRAARELAGMSQGTLARRLGISRTSVVNIEAGRQRLPLYILWQIGDIVRTEACMLFPRQSEYQEQLQPISLNAETVVKIEEVANGDPFTKQLVTEFITKIKAESTP